MKQRHLFVIDPLEELNLALDSSLRMAKALADRGHRIFFATLRDLSWHSGKGAAWARSVEATFAGNDIRPRVSPKSRHDLSDFDAIHMRKDPPFDLSYIEATWLLDSVASKVRIYNQPSALRNFNEKVSILLFPDDIKPALVSSDPSEIIDFIESECGGDAVVKPLALFGGHGVERIKIGEGGMPASTATAQITGLTRDGAEKRMVQRFDKQVFEGEVRAFCVGGEPIAWCLKRPAKGEFLANTRAGATLEPWKPSAAEIARVKNVASRLALSGAPIVGFDLIGGYVSEINITSPRLLLPPGDAAASSAAYEKFASWIERDI
jgi:glutathione synthase